MSDFERLIIVQGYNFDCSLFSWWAHQPWSLEGIEDNSIKWNEIFPHLCTRLNNCCLTINTQKSLLLFLSTTIPQWIWVNKNVWGRGKNLQFSICRCAMHKKINSQLNSTTPTKKKSCNHMNFRGARANKTRLINCRICSWIGNGSKCCNKFKERWSAVCYSHWNDMQWGFSWIPSILQLKLFQLKFFLSQTTCLPVRDALWVQYNHTNYSIGPYQPCYVCISK